MIDSAREKHRSFKRNASKWTWKEKIKSLFLHSEMFKDSRSWLGCKVTMRQLSASVDVVDLLWGAVQWVAKCCKDSARAREYSEYTPALDCTTDTKKTWKTYADDVGLFWPFLLQVLDYDIFSSFSVHINGKHISICFDMFWLVWPCLTMFDHCYCSFLISLVLCQIGQFSSKTNTVLILEPASSDISGRSRKKKRYDAYVKTA